MTFPQINNDILNEKEISTSKKYFDDVIHHLIRYAPLYDDQISKCISLIKVANDQRADIFVYGAGFNTELAEHANVDWVKFAFIKTMEMGIPTLTAYGNDYQFQSEITEYLTHRGFGSNSVFVGINLGEKDGALDEAIKYCTAIGGISILLTNNREQLTNAAHGQIFIETTDEDLAGDIAQTFTHHIATNLAQHHDTSFKNAWTGSYTDYSYYLIKALEHKVFSDININLISDVIDDAVQAGKSVYAFGNGGSAAMASYFIQSLQKIYKSFPGTLRSIINLSLFSNIINESIRNGSYKQDIYSNILTQLGIAEDDVLVGISTSGNSTNIIHPFNNFPQLQKIAVLGFGNGGILGASAVVDFSIIIPDEYAHRSYAIAEDGQRIALTAILKYLKTKNLNDNYHGE